MRRALIFSPYFDTMGGGEVYALNFARCIQNTHEVSLAWKTSDVFKKANDFFGIRLKHKLLEPRAFDLLTSKDRLISKHKYLKSYDLIFFVSDGSLPWLSSKNNIVHFQVPFTSLKRGPINTFKLRSIHHIVCNSNFTKSVIDNKLKIDSKVIYPPVSFKPTNTKKENTILSVGRFTDTLHNKRQDILIKAFKQLVNHGLKGWTLQLVGSTSQKEANEFVSQLRTRAKKYPIEFHLDVSSNDLKLAYSKAKIFWHAAGFDINENRHPEKVEHFGISVVEAMSAGCVPVVVNKGGLKEIVTDKSNGFLFGTINQLTSKTNKLISDSKLMSKLSKAATISADKFSLNNFCQNVQSLT